MLTDVSLQAVLNNMYKDRLFTVVRVIGMLLILEAILMSSCLIISYLYAGEDSLSFLKSTLITLFVGLSFYFPLLKYQIKVDKRLGYLIVSLVWLIMSAFGALPYWFSGYIPSYTDAYFETMSGFTTTGASIISNVEILPKGLLFWRALTNWIGGIGIVVIVISIIPFIGGGGMSLFAAEVAGPSKNKFSPHIRTTGKILIVIYSTLTLISILSLWIAGMSLFDATCHSFSALSSGGFSTKNASAAAFSPLIQYLLILFMIPSGINFTLFYYAIKKQYNKIWVNEELKTYILIILIATAILTVFIFNPILGLEEAIRNSLFQVVSLLTSTGFVNTDYRLWITPAVFTLFLLMFSGAMSGSTTGGLKIIRIILLFKNARKIVQRSVHSNAILSVKFEKRIVQEQVIFNVLAMFLLYIVTYLIAVLVLILSGLGMMEAIGGTVSCLSNMGPGLGECGGFGNYAGFSDFAKWLFSALMYLGRLELMTVIILLIPAFWKK